MNFDRLRFVAERAELVNAAKPFCCRDPEERALRKFCECIGKRTTEFNHRIADEKKPIFLWVCIQNRADAAKMVETFVARVQNH